MPLRNADSCFPCVLRISTVIINFNYLTFWSSQGRKCVILRGRRGQFWANNQGRLLWKPSITNLMILNPSFPIYSVFQQNCI